MAKEEEIDGVRFVRTHSGQRKAYGDTFYDFAVFSDLPKDEVERVCREKVYKALSLAEWRELNKQKPSAENYFKPHYTFTGNTKSGYSYSVCLAYTD